VNRIVRNLRRVVSSIAVAAAVSTLGIVALTATSPTQAKAAPQVQICNNANNRLVCMSRAFAGTANGTEITGGVPGNAANDFEWLIENDRCGGQVIDTCPFNDEALNSTYKGMVLVRIYEILNNKCAVGNAGPNAMVLWGCNGYAHTYLLPGCLKVNYNTCGLQQFHNVINVDAVNLAEGECVSIAWSADAIGNPVVPQDDCASDPQDAMQLST
jgi:hypothetical protein